MKMASSNLLNPSDGKIKLFELEKDKNYTEEIYKIQQGDVVAFILGPSLFGQSVTFFTNAPIKNKKFVRSEYTQLPFNTDKNETDIPSVVIPFHIPGNYHFYLMFNGKINSSGYILVDPILNPTSVNDLRCLTVISKNLGHFSSWQNKFTVASKCGYNMIHFTPIQKLGGSNSAYSICDQLCLNPIFSDSKKTVKFDDIKQFLENLKKEKKMMSICDIVLNHTANETQWLIENPECAFNLDNCPHLRPAYVLDSLLHKLSVDISSSVYVLKGVPPLIETEEQLEALRHLLWVDILHPAKIIEMYTVDVSSVLEEFQSLCRKLNPNKQKSHATLSIIQDPFYRRLESSIDMDVALEVFNIYWNGCYDEENRLKKCSAALKDCLDKLNKEKEAEINSHLDAAVNNVIANVRYFRLQEDGPKLKELSVKHPLVPRYFLELGEPGEEQILNGKGRFVMAHNGWVMGDDPLKNFADSDSNVYLRRELIAWGDSVKLRYGEKEDDCPYLWKKMKDYVELTASIFDGVRIDNCHSTPIHVAQYFLDAARKVKPTVYVVAELFTNSDKTDNIFVNKLGINSLIRESMSAGDSHELGRMLYRFGGRPVGSLKSHTNKLTSSIAHAMLFDQTHDNPSPVKKRSPYDLLPSAALVSWASCAIGSNYGYDHLVPHHIDVVEEVREYIGIKEETEFNCKGITIAKNILYSLRENLDKQNFDQIFVDQIDKDIICVTRHNSETLVSYLLFAYTSFQQPDVNSSGLGKGVTIYGSEVDLIHSEAFLEHRDGNRFSGIKEFTKDKDFINGLSEYKLKISENVPFEKSNFLKIIKDETSVRINLTDNFQPGSIVILRLQPSNKTKEAVSNLVNYSKLYEDKLAKVLSQINLIDINYILFKCGQEEPSGLYNIPGFGDLVYAGLEGVIHLMDEIVEKDDQAHPLCSNIREGSWLSDYICFRLMKNMKTRPLGELLKERLDLLKLLPPGQRPFHFYKIVSSIYCTIKDLAFSLMTPFVREGNELTRLLALSSVQFVGVEDSCTLPTLSEKLCNKPTLPLSVIAAGLPHFSSGYMRSWGRDTFISLRGLLLVTGRYKEARNHIIGYGGCLRHGLIPNLLDSGNNPRYNCRDAVWWWLYSIKCYVEMVPKGHQILSDVVNRLFPTDSSPKTSQDMILNEVIQEALNVHFQGLTFRERNAGTNIDQHMTDLGFDNQIGVHPVTGFVFGGNEWNCGTWMDKMGSSSKAGTKGRPATPRDGSSVEIVALSYSVIRWLHKMHKEDLYPFSGVTRKQDTSQGSPEIKWTWLKWSQLIETNFETHFWVPADSQDKYAFRKNIYKDTFGSSHPWSDYRLRPNFIVAMAVAPELFSKECALKALEVAESTLLGPLGMKTLDPEDIWYCGYYDNSNDSSDEKVAHGFNYHQGPEWLWPVGFYLRSLLLMSPNDAVVNKIKRYLSTHWSFIKSSPWGGLPELTNENGVDCPHGCPTQAWSVATILEVLYDMKKFN